MSELARLGAQLAADPRSEVVRVDCAGVTFLDCSALRVLLDIDLDAATGGKVVCWRHVPACIRRVLELTRTSSSIALVD